MKKKANSKTNSQKDNGHLFTEKNKQEKIAEKLKKIKQEHQNYIKEHGRTWLN